MYVYMINRHIFVCVYMSVRPLLHKQFNLPPNQHVSNILATWSLPGSCEKTKAITSQLSSSVPERYHRCESRRSGHLVDHTWYSQSFPKRRNRDWGLLGFMFGLRALYLGGMLALG